MKLSSALLFINQLRASSQQNYEISPGLIKWYAAGSHGNVNIQLAVNNKETVVLRRWEYYKIIWFYQLSWVIM